MVREQRAAIWPDATIDGATDEHIPPDEDAGEGSTQV